MNGGSWTTASTTNRWTNWTASVTLSNGANTISAYAVDPAAMPRPSQRSPLIHPSATLTVSNNGNGTFSPKDNGKLLAIGTNYTLDRLPGKKLDFLQLGCRRRRNFVSNNPVLKFTCNPI